MSHWRAVHLLVVWTAMESSRGDVAALSTAMVRGVPYGSVRDVPREKSADVLLTVTVEISR